MNHEEIRERFAALRAEGRRHRDAAEALGITEGVAIAAHACLHERALHATPLRGPWIGLLQSLELCGPLLALTRNASTVHEKTGVYQKLSGSGHVGLALGEEIDLRLFFNQWHAGFAVSEASANAGQPPSLSLQFFDPSGVAVHKIFAREATDRDALQSIIDTHADVSATTTFGAAAPKAPPLADGAVDAAGLIDAWRAMQDTHEFFGLLNKFEVERQQSFRLAEGVFTQRAEPRTLRELLHEASFTGTPIMVFVGSPGCIQIHTGPVTHIEPMEMRGMRWLNVLDPGFNLHLREDLVASVWIVTKPTTDGVVTSVEAFDRDGGLMAMFFGARKPGIPEREEWRELVRKLPRMEVAA
jgi:putative hemin transport protein